MAEKPADQLQAERDWLWGLCQALCGPHRAIAYHALAKPGQAIIRHVLFGQEPVEEDYPINSYGIRGCYELLKTVPEHLKPAVSILIDQYKRRLEHEQKPNDP